MVESFNNERCDSTLTKNTMATLIEFCQLRQIDQEWQLEGIIKDFKNKGFAKIRYC